MAGLHVSGRYPQCWQVKAYRPRASRWRSPSDDRRAASALSARSPGRAAGQGGIGVAVIPQHHGVEHQSERAELVCPGPPGTGWPARSVRRAAHADQVPGRFIPRVVVRPRRDVGIPSGRRLAPLATVRALPTVGFTADKSVRIHGFDRATSCCISCPIRTLRTNALPGSHG